MNQELEREVTALLTDVFGFLETLGPLHLSELLNTECLDLLTRTRCTLEKFEQPGPYLDMTLGCKTASTSSSASPSSDLVYETFQPESSSLDPSSLSACEARSRATKWGQLQQKREPRKMSFGFATTKSCCAAILGRHLLLYSSEVEARPYLQLALEGYRARPIPFEPRAFEIFCPGDRTFQFLAATAQSLDEWIEAIDAGANSVPAPAAPETPEPSRTSRPHQAIAVATPTAPILKSRKLPPPPQSQNQSMRHCNDEDHYHKIDDVMSGNYENLPVGTGSVGETYDDIDLSLSGDKSPVSVAEFEEVPQKEKPTVKPAKSNTKRSFLDRVRNRKESPRKDDNIKIKEVDKIAVVTESSSPTHDVLCVAKIEFIATPSYDDITNLHSQKNSIEDSNYISPPAPRPIYTTPPQCVQSSIVLSTQTEEIYDDIGYHLDENGKINDKTNGETEGENSADEHYQIPKSHQPVIKCTNQEELYDDVSVVDPFKTRQKTNEMNKAYENNHLWTRKSSIKKSKTGDKKSTNDPCEISNGTDTITRIKPLQKFISRVENSFGKSSKISIAHTKHTNSIL